SPEVSFRYPHESVGGAWLLVLYWLAIVPVPDSAGNALPLQRTSKPHLDARLRLWASPCREASKLLQSTHGSHW
ncbi:hypothetical protein, partial [Roseomonas sp. KE2513]|uniref:hypothetical protein n=1 Tax=Roseomonas sp. KE2513 TaxID=2479202 RepID=UPI001E486CA1